MALEIEDRLLAEAGGVEIAGVHDQLVLLACALSATISPSGLTMTLQPNMGFPSSTPALATATTQVEF